MLKTEHKSYRLTAKTVRQIAELAQHWGTIEPVSAAAVIAACVDRVHSAQLARRKPAAPRAAKKETRP